VIRTAARVLPTLTPMERQRLSPTSDVRHFLPPRLPPARRDHGHSSAPTSLARVEPQRLPVSLCLAYPLPPTLAPPGNGNRDPPASGNVVGRMFGENRIAAAEQPESDKAFRDSKPSNDGHARRDRHRGEGNDMSISDLPRAAVDSVDTVYTLRPAVWPAAAFIMVEIILVAETISVMLLKELDPTKPGAAPVAVLLSIALLANLGVVCTVAAASAARSVRRARLEEAWVLESPAGDVAVTGSGMPTSR